MARTVGFFTDTTLCIGCKACEVACKEWNQLPGHAPQFGDGYDNTGQLDEQNWRHVQFHERTTAKGGVAWNMMRNVAGARLNQLRGQGMSEARLYGDKEYGGLHALFLLTDKPEAYGLPNTENAVLPSRNNMRSYLGSLVTAALGIIGAVFAFRERGGKE